MHVGLVLRQTVEEDKVAHAIRLRRRQEVAASVSISPRGNARDPACAAVLGQLNIRRTVAARVQAEVRLRL